MVEVAVERARLLGVTLGDLLGAGARVRSLAAVRARKLPPVVAMRCISLAQTQPP